ncbi:hypothetical protein FM114_07560 [Luteococcus japonicus LSP_Lj1]|uniref:Uncharacterized protein n=1 Tax=Luteococcus japonicus LSP_Lj1 TaxID=1255658 RepID=A0A1R4JGX2_9ACTN|nr:hypothetical protein FM114_07560 [Luteococcus japonicus LSP_Lj1]
MVVTHGGSFDSRVGACAVRRRTTSHPTSSGREHHPWVNGR